MRKSDWLWLLAFPIYLILGSIRHELGHALVVLAQGGEVTEFVFIPGIKESGYLYFGYVSYNGITTWVTAAAPYILDLFTFTLFFAVCVRFPFRRHWVWLNLVILGLISPFINSFYQYLKPVFNIDGDVPFLFTKLPRVAVHGYFLFTLGLYAAGLVLVFRRSTHFELQGELNE